MITWNTRESSEAPKTVDTESSRTKVYLTRNDREEIRDNMDGTKTTMHVYEEAELTHEEYEAFIRDQLAGEIVTDKTGTTANQYSLMEGMADIFDMLAEIQAAQTTGGTE